MRYGLVLNTNISIGCAGPETREEAVEFSMRTNTSGVYGPWIPLRLTWRWPDSVGGNYTISRENVRGYEVESHGVPPGGNYEDGAAIGVPRDYVDVAPLSMVAQHVTICGEDQLPANASEVQFRWMNTAEQPGRFDMWAIFNVTADLITNNGGTFRILDTQSSE